MERNRPQGQSCQGALRDPDLVGRGVPGPEAGLAGPCVLLRGSTAATLAGGVPWEALKDRARARLPADTAALLLPQMAVLEIQTNGDTRVSEEAIVRARHSLDDPNMRVSAVGRAWGCSLTHQ